MAANPDHYGTFTFLDFSEEKSSMKFHFGPITALTIAAFLTQFGALRTAVEDICIGTLSDDSWTGDATNYAAAAPTDPNAQRERKWLVQYEGTTSHTIYNFTIPTANLAGTDFLIPGTDEADLTTTEIAAFVTAFEAIGKSPYQEAVNVLNIYAVGRNN